MHKMTGCSYCSNKNKERHESFLTCSNCNKHVHLNCLKSGKIIGGLLGDVFYKFVCQECSPSQKEEFSRQKMSWINLIVLTLYNLHQRSEGMSQRGYFHWKIHICNFIDINWNILFGDSLKRKKSWMGTISGTLSHYSPTYFRSGSDELKEPGWWRLTHSLTPQQIMELHSKTQLEKKKFHVVKSVSEGQVKVCDFARMQYSAPSSPIGDTPSPSVASSRSHQGGNDDSSLSAYDETSSNELNTVESELEVGTPTTSGRVSTTGSFTGWGSLKASENMYSRAYVEPSETLSDCLFADDEDNCTDMDVDIEEVESLNICCPSAQGFRDLGDFLQPVTSSSTSPSECGQFPQILGGMSKDEGDPFLFPLDEMCAVDVETTVKKECMSEDMSDAGLDEPGSDAGDESATKLLPKSLFTTRPKGSKVVRPWELNNSEDTKEQFEAKCVPMSEYEELQLLNQLRRIPNVNDLPGTVRRLYRKLCVRRMKRERNMPLFNLDNAFLGSQPRSVWKRPIHDVRGHSGDDVRVLDRFQHVTSPSAAPKQSNCSFMLRLMGQSEPTCFSSPYTQRLLKPYIRRDYDSTPLWLKLMQEIEQKANKSFTNWKPSRRCPIDYSYVRPQHIATINSLCSEFFYPGIDLTECLQYPDFSCVVLYKKLIIGFAFMVPDVGYNETYISFLFTRVEWRRAGIGSFMLYHLIQTCMGKDVTLHVSATNSALILYQKFGFKVDEFVQDFYDKYFPADSKECRHALFLRLSR